MSKELYTFFTVHGMGYFARQHRFHRFLRLSHFSSAKAEGYLKAAASFGALVAVDPESADKERQNVFSEFLQVCPT